MPHDASALIRQHDEELPMLPLRTQGNWGTIALVYVIGLMSMALVGILSPPTLRITEAMVVLAFP